ncbi:glycoside hydrolase family protein [Hymenobacter metallilatus]|uniref:Uncharacterized protein n=1 Tax=Hymenobacter metallilatus TaxID=2493666 RepID=A0A428JTZ1_9BACT|nr:hypothetical protein [Hymenobacter metallilatus]RSK37516.1 hypothetical protein EI290_02385 [Hymenobacter metallilatus]
MTRTGPSFYFSSSPGSVAPGALPVPNGYATVQQSWQQVHGFLTTYVGQASSGLELCGLTMYYYHVYKFFGQAQDAALVRSVYEQLLANLRAAGPVSWGADELEQVRVVAWLTARLAQDGLLPTPSPAPLRHLDARLAQEAHRLQQQPGPTSTRNFIRILQYFSLRLPEPGAEASLYELLQAWPTSARQAERSVCPDLALSLTDGLAGELLLLLQLHKAGVTTVALEERLRTGIQQLLATRQEVDFSAGRYSVFPRVLLAPYQQAVFSAELTWAHGDLGHSWLLYEAHAVWQDAELARIAELVGLNTLLRTTASTTEVTTASFFQGSAGVAHLYRRLHGMSGHAAYRTGYLHWLGHTLAQLAQELPYATESSFVASMPFGLVGVGLLLLAEVADQKTDWDTLLL